MSRIRRGGYVFLTWSGDHTPRHVHVYRGGRLIAKWNLEAWTPMQGRVNRTLVRLLLELRDEGLL
ncbi:MAG: hypothetical protein Q7W51_05990 [Coriobacteriia bacterium]|nr:hypothetical protein [Coriobacteriia bacterium]